MGEETCPNRVQGSPYQEIQDKGGDGGLGVIDLKHDRQQGHKVQQQLSLRVLRVFKAALVALSTQYEISEKLVQQLPRGTQDKNRGQILFHLQSMILDKFFSGKTRSRRGC